MPSSLVQEKLIARDVFTGETVEVVVADGQILSVHRAQQTPQTEPAPETGADIPWIAPGLVDIQINGYAGHDFTAENVTPEDVWAVAEAMFPLGVTRFLPTITTQSHERLIHAVRTVAQACGEYPLLKECLPGIHLEGPFISPQDGPRGAHPRDHVRPPNWDEFRRLQDAARGLIRLITLSPEYPEAIPFIERAIIEGVVIAIGHTAASPQQIEAAVSAGASLSTHLGNGCHLMLPRHPNYLWTQLAEDRLWASFIFDGHHLPADFMQVAVRAKGVTRTILVSDLTAIAGLTPGRYATPLGDVELLPEGRLVVAGQRQLLAGAAQPLLRGVENAMSLVGLPLVDAVTLATRNPCQLLGLPWRFLQPGSPAEFVLFRLQEKTRDRAGGLQDTVPMTRSVCGETIEILRVYFRAEKFPR